MTEFEKLDQHIFQMISIRVEAPEGTIFVTIIEDDNGKPIAIDLSLGKAGTSVRTWTQSLARIMTVGLEHGATIDNFIEELSGQRTDRSRRSGDGIDITSGPEAICYALMKYKREKYQARRNELGINDDSDAERKGRGARLAS